MAQAFKSAKILWICHRSKLSLFTVFAIVTGTVFIIFSFYVLGFAAIVEADNSNVHSE